MLVRGNSPELLKELVRNPKLPCRQDKEFLCGLCAQLEQAIKTKVLSSDDKVIKVLEAFLVEQGENSKHSRVREWVRLLADATGRPNLIKLAKHGRLPSILGFSPHEYGTTRYPMVEAEEPQGELLSEAWKICLEAHIFYADQVIQHRYTDAALGLLKIERLSGDTLPMDQCYINLAIQRGSAEGHEAKQTDKDTPSPFSLHRRLQIGESPASNRVSLPDLFHKSQGVSGANSRDRSGNCSSAPEQQSYHMRILIRGQAGVGKSTLCKKMVYDFIHNAMWADIIDRVIWLPLRNLKGKDNWTVEQLLREEYFRANKLLANALRKAFYKDRSRTLFILDGLDEVSKELDSRSELLLTLLDQPRAIITTRPYAINWDQIRSIDLQVETVGFYPRQVKEYIAAIAPDKADHIQAFVQSHPVVEGLARIPIQLDALCYSLEAKTMHTSDVPKSMTELYKAIIKALWDKDVGQLEKRRQGREITKTEAQRSDPKDIRDLVESEINVLQALAFSGLCNNVIEFDSKYRERFRQQRDNIMASLPGAKNNAWSSDLDKLSFLRTSDGRTISMTGSYHFLHLTFQEFFAAQFFVEHWKSGNPLSWVLSGGETKHIKAEIFLGKEKYNARYDIFWRFVGGLLQAEGNGEQLCCFFETIEKEPLDLLGPTHQRLVMHCLSEISTKMPFRERLQEELKLWLLFECTFQSEACLSGETEFPEQALRDALREGPDDAKIKILSSLQRRPGIPPSVIDLVASWRRDDMSEPLRLEALRVLQTSPKLTTKVLVAVTQQLADKCSPRLGNEVWYVREVALRVLGKQSCLSDEIITTIVQRLGDEDQDVRAAALGVLEKQSSLSDEIITTIVQRIGDEYGSIVNMPDGVRSAGIDNVEEYMDMVIKARPPNAPPTAGRLQRETRALG
ncbi:hypothetical protein TOPH_05346, partial [Tolypocladium ophioglossoides CBS 100239]